MRHAAMIEVDLATWTYVALDEKGSQLHIHSLRWCNENCSQDYSCGLNKDTTYGLWFKSEKDAFNYKLKFATVTNPKKDQHYGYVYD